MIAVPAAGPFDTVAGLPVHALVVHAVVVLVPVTSLGAIVIAIVPRWSRRFGILVPLFALAAAGAAVVAQLSGEQLAARVGLPADHASLGASMKWFALALLVVTTALWLADNGRQGSRPVWVKILAVVVILVAVASTWWVVLTGDSGARAVWEPVVTNTPPPP